MKYPDAIIVDNHMGCNARCGMCPLSASSRTRGTMSERHFSRIVEQVREFYDHLRVVYLGLHGEPLLDADLEGKIRRFNALGTPKCVIHSNASLLNGERARSLLESGVSGLILSLESLDPVVYESIRKGLRHSQVLENILNFVSLRDAMGSPASVQVRFIVQRKNLAERERYMEFWRERLRPGLDEAEAVTLHNYLEPLPGVSDYGRAPCDMFLTSFVVLNDGSYPLCCLDYEKRHDFGNIDTTSILDAFNSPALQALRAMHREGRRDAMKICGRCIYPELGGPTPTGEHYIERFIKE